MIVTIDGPAASGKTSVSRELASRYGWDWVSTGAFYRGLAFVCRELKVDIKKEKEVAAACEKSDWEIVMNKDRTAVFFGGKDVTDSIYSEDVASIASQISLFPEVRKALLKAQQDCALGAKGLVAEGRDCGTVVFPDASVKIFLTAHSQSRAERRAKEEGKSLLETQRAQSQRDQQDSTRAAAPMQIPENAHVVDTSNMDLGEVVSHLESLIKNDLQGRVP